MLNKFIEKIKKLDHEQLHILTSDLRAQYKIGLISAKDMNDLINTIQIEIFERELNGKLYER